MNVIVTTDCDDFIIGLFSNQRVCAFYDRTYNFHISSMDPNPSEIPTQTPHSPNPTTTALVSNDSMRWNDEGGVVDGVWER